MSGDGESGRSSGEVGGGGLEPLLREGAGPESCDSHPGPSASLTSCAPWLLGEEVARPQLTERGFDVGEGSEEGGAGVKFWIPFRNLLLLRHHGNQAAAGGAACGGGSLGAAWMGVSRAGGKDLLLSLPAGPAQGEGEGGSGGWACRSPCLSLSFGVCNMGVTMQYPAQVLWEADIPAGLIRGAP